MDIIDGTSDNDTGIAGCSEPVPVATLGQLQRQSGKWVWAICEWAGDDGRTPWDDAVALGEQLIEVAKLGGGFRQPNKEAILHLPGLSGWRRRQRSDASKAHCR